ncbi:MAG: N-acetyltransferase [Clostridiales bacterium]|jgi:predicted GNAT family acetyltransferase|nr:N-acetyltransferase [Clostridiales bacterium]
MKFIHESDRIYLQDGEGKMIAEITFPQISDTVVELDGTFVDPSLRGQGVADALVREAISDIKAKGLKAKATCPYVIGWFEKHPEHADILD